MSIPAYEQNRRRERGQLIAQFLNDLVISDEFDSEDFKTVEEHLSSANDELSAFCDWFGLGGWFYDEMTDIEFNLDDFMTELGDRITQLEREAEEDRRDREQDYRDMVGGL